MPSGRDNPDNQSRPIVVRPDRAPDISIVSPDPKTPLKVRPDDSVPISFIASDDFGISKIEARVRVDDRSPQTLQIPILSHDRRASKATGPSTLPAVIKPASATNARHVTVESSLLR